MFDLPTRRRHPYRVILVLIVLLAMVWAISGYKVEIHYAAKKGHLFVVSSLVWLNPQLVFSRDSNGDTPLHLAASEGHKNVVEFLIAHRANVNAENDFGETPLSYSLIWDHRAVAELLLAHGADVNPPRGGSSALLSIAASNGDAELVSMLLAKNANAIESQPLNRANGKAVVELLLAHGADLHGRDWIGRTPLEDAAADGRVEAMAALLAHETKNNVTSTASAALQAAAAEGRYEAVEYLLTHGADVNARCYNGKPPGAGCGRSQPDPSAPPSQRQSTCRPQVSRRSHPRPCGIQCPRSCACGLPP
jgi:ankyrin repeat protein